MPLARILGQERAAQMALVWLRTGRLPHAILCAGPPGTGKRQLAVEFVKAMLCAAPGDDACDECATCHKVAGATHPDVHFLAPISGSKAGRDEAAMQTEMRQAVAETLSGTRLAPSSAANISRAHLRLLQREMSYAPAEGNRRIAVVFDAECMHPAGANALLKTLEEPPDRAVFVLVSASPERIVPTIRSRCQRLLLRRLRSQDVRTYLTALDLPPERVELGVQMGGGNLHRAMAAAEGRLDAVRDRVERFLFAGVGRDDAVYWSVCSELGGRDTRAEMGQFLEICGVYLRDVFLQSAGCIEALSLIDRREVVGRLAVALSPVQVEAAAQEVDRTVDYLTRNVNPNLVLADLWRCLRRARQPLGAGAAVERGNRQSAVAKGT